MDSFGNGWVSPLQDQETPHMDLVGEMQDGGFEPQARARSNTWPCPRPTEESESTKVINQQLANVDSQQASHNIGSSKKNSSRRNAWGNLSYADLITHAIGSATEKRLTLSQIYEWMVQNVPYFKDKGDSNSSAGWKNSIRHNLSLHNRFMRVQNEGTGKSSWWMLNPDAKPGKSVRRRAASMETSRYEKRRGRAKKRVEALRNAGFTGLHDATPSPSSSVSEGLDHFSESPLHSGGFQLSPDFRQRASSNASSCGRLSPIPALVGLELDWSFKVDYQNTNVASAQSIALDQLAGSIRDDLSLQKDILQGFSATPVTVSQPSTTYDPPQPYSINTAAIQSYGMQQNQCHLHRTLTCACLENKREGLSPSSGSEISSAYPNIDPPSDSLLTYGIVMESSGILTNDNANLVEQQQTQEQQSFISNLEANCTLTTIGQCMETSNNQTQSDEFNIDNFQGGLECNIEELLQQEMSIDGLLDINIPLTAAVTTTAANRSTHLQPNQPSNNNAISTTLDLPQNETGTSHTRVQYSQSSVTPPSWVH